MFHWHIVDSQSFPLEVPDFPEIAEKGAYSADEVYSASDVQDLVSYAGAVCPLLIYYIFLSNIFTLSAESTS